MLCLLCFIQPFELSAWRLPSNSAGAPSTFKEDAADFVDQGVFTHHNYGFGATGAQRTSSSTGASSGRHGSVGAKHGSSGDEGMLDEHNLDKKERRALTQKRYREKQVGQRYICGCMLGVDMQASHADISCVDIQHVHVHGCPLLA